VTPDDSAAVRQLCLAAFEGEEAAIVAKLAVEILVEATSPPCIVLVATEGDELIGYAAFSFRRR
jgi:predicted N-acetyltransferase YhbS